MLTSGLFHLLRFIRDHAEGVYLDDPRLRFPRSYQPIRIDYLCDCGFVERFPAGDSYGLRILPKGEVELEIYNAHIRSVRISTVRYWITTLIALAALAKSFSPELSEAWAWLQK